jgi:hypothetical protein
VKPDAAYDLDIVASRRWLPTSGCIPSDRVLLGVEAALDGCARLALRAPGAPVLGLVRVRWIDDGPRLIVSAEASARFPDARVPDAGALRAGVDAAAATTVECLQTLDRLFGSGGN